MEEWRDLARTVPPSLLSVADKAMTQVPGTIVRAVSKLAKCIVLLQKHRSGNEIHEDSAFQGRPPAWYSASAILDGARRELFYLRVLHAGAGNVFNLYSTRPRPSPLPRFLQDNPEWQPLQRCQSRHFHAVDHSAKALQNLRSAASHARASRHAFLVAQTFPLRSPDRKTWLTAALKLSRIAYRDAIVALHDSRRMSRAVTLEFFDAWMVLNAERVAPPGRLLRPTR